MDRDFIVVLRGYDRTEVDQVLGRAEVALASGSASLRAASLAELGKGFVVTLRGYDRGQVDNVVRTLVVALRAAGGDNGGGEGFRPALAAVLRLDQPGDQEIIDEVRRLRELADRA